MKFKLTSFARVSWLTVALAGCSLLLTGCNDFEKSWAESLAAAKEKGGKFESIEGPWDGTWKSDVNGHHGKLRCIITRQENGEYEFHYWAQWQVVFSGSYKANHKTAVDGVTHTFQGEKDLGKLGGIYKHEGKTTADSITATYTSTQGDKGVYEMKRPTIKPEVPAPKTPQ